MKKITSLIVISLLSSFAIGQKLDTIYVSTNRTVVAIFASRILSVDLGTTDFIYDVDQNTLDMIKLKSAFPNVQPTSYMVRTEKELYTGIIAFKPLTGRLQYDFRINEQIKQSLTKEEGQSRAVEREKKVSASTPKAIKQREFEENRYANIEDEDVKRKVWDIFNKEEIHFYTYAHKANDMIFSLTNLYVDSKYLYLKMSINNPTSISFNIDFVSFELETKGKKTKNSAEQTKLFYSSIYESVKRIEPQSKTDVIYVIDLYAFEKKDKLTIKINELKGERTFNIQVPGSEINNAKRIKQL